MIDESKAHAEMAAAAIAKAELGTTAHAFDALRKAYFVAWMTSGQANTEDRERLWLAGQIITQVENSLKGVVTNGKVAEDDLARITTNLAAE